MLDYLPQSLVVISEEDERPGGLTVVGCGCDGDDVTDEFDDIVLGYGEFRREGVLRATLVECFDVIHKRRLVWKDKEFWK